MYKSLSSTSAVPRHAISYTNLLLDYLMHRPDSKGNFYISEWLTAITDDTLYGLQRRFEIAISGSLEAQGALFDLMSLCKLTFDAEKCSTRLLENQKFIANVLSELETMCAVVELSNQGIIKLLCPLKLSSAEVAKYPVTEDERQFGLNSELIPYPHKAATPFACKSKGATSQR